MKNNANATQTDAATQIHYKNITANQFSDLTLAIQVEAQGQVFDLSDQFRPNMIMIGHDSRQKWFKTLASLKAKGCDLAALASSSPDVLLKLSYTYTHAGGKRSVPCQDYKWDWGLEQWVLL